MKLKIPKIAFGTYRLKGKICFNAVSNAIELGYRMIDTAQVYGNEAEVGKAVYFSSVPRKNIFISSKLWFPYHNVEENILKSCDRLRTDYIDLYLIHKPNHINPKEHLKAFEQLEQCRQKGLIRSIGVTSFNLEDLEKLVTVTGILPDLVQEECHPFFQQKHLQEKVESMGSIFQAWYPLGSGDKRLFNNLTLKSIASEHSVTVPSLILMWHIQEGHNIVVKSTNIRHMKNNLDIQSDTSFLSETEMEQIRKLDVNKSYVTLPNWAQTLLFKSPIGRLV